MKINVHLSLAFAFLALMLPPDLPPATLRAKNAWQGCWGDVGVAGKLGKIILHPSESIGNMVG